MLCFDVHQKGKSPLQDLGILIVTRVPFEIMHLVYFGVTMRLLSAWYDGKFGYAAKLHSLALNKMSSRYRVKQVLPKRICSSF